MMSVGLHCRLAGRPGKAAGLARFLEYLAGFDDVWCARRIDIARHWARRHPPRRIPPSEPDVERGFRGPLRRNVRAFAWIAEQAHDLELGPAHDCAAGVHNALCRVFRSAPEAQRRGVLEAHPDLAGKLAAARRLTPESAQEQSGAKLDALTDAERAEFTRLNDEYVSRHGFPFIIAVRDHSRTSILEAFRRRVLE